MPKRKRGKKPTPVTTRVLLIAELVAEILSWLDVPTLCKCLCVNILWFNEGVRFLWVHPGPMDRHIPLARYFTTIEDTRKQVYANFVKTANIVDINNADAIPFRNSRRYIDALFGLHFPRMHTLNVLLEIVQCGVNIPWIDAPSVQVLHINMYLRRCRRNFDTPKYVGNNYHDPNLRHRQRRIKTCLATLINVSQYVPYRRLLDRTNEYLRIASQPSSRLSLGIYV